MREFQEKKRVKKVLYSMPILIVMAILVIFFAHATWGVYKKERESASNTAAATGELAKLEARTELLNKQIAKLKTEEGMEEEIRSKYNVSKPGENVIVIVNADKASGTPAQSKESWWGRFKKLFK